MASSFDPTSSSIRIQRMLNARRSPVTTSKLTPISTPVFHAARIGRAVGGPIDSPASPITGPIITTGGGRTDDHPVHVPSGAYVLPADIVSHIGEGNSLAGMKLLTDMFGAPWSAKGGPLGAMMPKMTQGPGPGKPSAPYPAMALPMPKPGAMYAGGGYVTPSSWKELLGTPDKRTAANSNRTINDKQFWAGYEDWLDRGSPPPESSVTPETILKTPKLPGVAHEWAPKLPFAPNQNIGKQGPYTPVPMAPESQGPVKIPFPANKNAVQAPSSDPDSVSPGIIGALARRLPFMGGPIGAGLTMAMTPTSTAPPSMDEAPRWSWPPEGHASGGVAPINQLRNEDEYQGFKSELQDLQEGHDNEPPRKYVPSNGILKAHSMMTAAGGHVHDTGDATPIMISGGEFVISPDEVKRRGGGNMNKGHKTLDAWVVHLRKKSIDTLKKLPGPAK